MKTKTILSLCIGFLFLVLLFATFANAETTSGGVSDNNIPHIEALSLKNKGIPMVEKVVLRDLSVDILCEDGILEIPVTSIEVEAYLNYIQSLRIIEQFMENTRTTMEKCLAKLSQLKQKNPIDSDPLESLIVVHEILAGQLMRSLGEAGDFHLVKVKELKNIHKEFCSRK